MLLFPHEPLFSDEPQQAAPGPLLRASVGHNGGSRRRTGAGGCPRRRKINTGTLPQEPDNGGRVRIPTLSQKRGEVAVCPGKNETDDRQVALDDSRKYKGFRLKRAAKGVGYNGQCRLFTPRRPCRE
jgi:hypothetical protein